MQQDRWALTFDLVRFAEPVLEGHNEADASRRLAALIPMLSPTIADGQKTVTQNIKP